MGRSVSVPTHAIATFYLKLPDEAIDEWEFVDMLDDFRNVIKSRYPSFEDDNTFVGREEKSILENEHGRIVIAEYCGLLSLSVVPDEHERNAYVELSRHWCEAIVPGLQAKLVECFPDALLRRVATASNGESFYEKEVQ
jgi:hypothetical protein